MSEKKVRILWQGELTWNQDPCFKRPEPLIVRLTARMGKGEDGKPMECVDAEYFGHDALGAPRWDDLTNEGMVEDAIRQALLEATAKLRDLGYDAETAKPIAVRPSRRH